MYFFLKSIIDIVYKQCQFFIYITLKQHPCICFCFNYCWIELDTCPIRSVINWSNAKYLQIVSGSVDIVGHLIPPSKFRVIGTIRRRIFLLEMSKQIAQMQLMHSPVGSWIFIASVVSRGQVIFKTQSNNDH